MPVTEAIKELAEKIRKREITSSEQLEREKIIVSKKYMLDSVVKNADIISHANGIGSRILRTKPVRTLSGVANIAVMWMPGSCPGSCIYCPHSLVGKNVPKSYTGVEPATMRAMRNDFDPKLQIKNRLKQLRAIGHPTDKCELIVMGGTFLSAEKEFQDNFIKGCLDALNEPVDRRLRRHTVFESKTPEEAQRLNETAKNRCVGLTIETRADYCKEEHIEQMLKLGCTRVELGIQSTDSGILKKIKRGHNADANIKAIKLLKEAGLKVCIHWMPGLTGLDGNIDMKKEIETFSELFANPEYRPDELKIYPTLVIPGTELHKLWLKGEYEPMTTEQTVQMLIEMKKIVPKYVRIKRIMRDISEKVVAAGPKTTNIRQLLHEEKGIICNCIRCREVSGKTAENIQLTRTDYEASGGKELFLGFENPGVLVAFLRLRLSGKIAKVRELHVYGEMAEIGKNDRDKQQHHGYGRMLLAEAERIAKAEGIKKIQVTSGVGARGYYRKLDYGLEGSYMVKDLHT